MLKNIPTIFSPELIKVLMEMGHGDEIVLGDGNFPCASHAKNLLRCDGHGIPELLDAILRFFPLDKAVERPVALMAVPQGNPYKPTTWDRYYSIVLKYEETVTEFEMLSKPDFYERAKKAYAVIATGERERFANIILRKGVVIHDTV